MKSNIASVVAAASLILAGSALAVEMPAVAKTKCGTCHTIEKKLVGPAWMDVSKKYKSDKQAANKIAASITKGGSFGWNLGVAMPPKGLGATDAEIKTLSEFIASLAK